MSIQDIGSLGEIVAAIATILTLAYLAIQIRENTKAVRSESRGRISGNFQGFSAILGGNKDAASVFSRGLTDFGSLSAEEQMQFVFLFSMVINVAYDMHRDYRLGVVDEDSLNANAKMSLELLETDGGQHYWKLYATSFDEKFREYIKIRKSTEN